MTDQEKEAVKKAAMDASMITINLLNQANITLLTTIQGMAKDFKPECGNEFIEPGCQKECPHYQACWRLNSINTLVEKQLPKLQKLENLFLKGEVNEPK